MSIDEIIQDGDVKDDAPVVADDLKNDGAKDDDKVVLTKAEHEALLKQREVAENYKKENEKYRQKKDRDVEKPKAESDSVLQEEQVVVVKNDYLSKREDVYDEFSEQFQKLEDNEWQKIKPLIIPAMDSIYFDAVQQGRYVPVGKLRRSIQDMIDYAKGDKSKKEAVDKARADTAKEMDKLNDAEIAGVKTSHKVPKSQLQVTDEDRRVAEDSGGVWTPERAAEIRLKREARAKEFAPNDQLPRW